MTYHDILSQKSKTPFLSRKRPITTFLSRKFMITRLSIAFEHFLGSSIASQDMPHWENTLFRQFIWMWHFVSRRCDYFQFFAIMISLIWNVSILSNTHPSEGNTCRWCLVASCPHTEDSWVGEMGWRGCALCAFVVCLPCACCHRSARVFPRELYDPQCLIPSMWLGSTRGQNRVQKYVKCLIQENQKFDNTSSWWSSIMVWRGSCIEIQFLMNAAFLLFKCLLFHRISWFISKHY